MPFKTGLTFTYDCGEFERSMDMALDLADFAGFAARRAESRRRGKLRGIGVSNSIERAAAAGLRGRRDPLRPRRHGDLAVGLGDAGAGPRDDLQADRLPTGSGSTPTTMQYVQGDTDKVFFGEGTGGSRSATIGGSAVPSGGRQDRRQGQAHRRATCCAVERGEIEFADGIFSSAEVQPHPHHHRGRARNRSIRAACRTAWSPGWSRLRRLQRAEVENFPNGCHVCELEIDPDTGAVEILRYSVVDDVGTVINPLLLEGQIIGGVAQGRGPGADGGHPLRRGIGPAPHRLVHGLRHAARRRFLRRCDMKSNPVPTKTNPLGVKGAGEAGCVGALPAVANAVVDALSVLGHPPHRNAGDVRAHLARAAQPVEMAKARRIAVVGAGLGGLAAAIALRQRGFDVQVYEQASELAEFGAGINISPNSVKFFRAVGPRGKAACGRIRAHRLLLARLEHRRDPL